MINKKQTGEFYETQAQQYLSNRGLHLIEKNYISRSGEIDLIMQDQDCLVFVEVRYRKNGYYGDAVSTIDIKKQNKIIKTAYAWMQEKEMECEHCEFRFDIFAITGSSLKWIKNAFSI